MTKYFCDACGCEVHPMALWNVTLRVEPGRPFIPAMLERHETVCASCAAIIASAVREMLVDIKSKLNVDAV